MLRVSADDRAVSEAEGVAVLVLLTITVTAALGVGVLLMTEEEQATAEFEFNYLDGSSALVITHDGGEQFAAGNLYIDGPENNVTWAELMNVDDNATVGSGDVAQVRAENAYGSTVGEDDVVEIVHDPPDDNRTVVARWN